MMIKYAGIIAISCAISIFGAVKASDIKQRSEIRREILRFLSHIESEIKYGASPLSEIYFSFKSDLFDKCGFTNALKQGCLYSELIYNTLSDLSSEEKSKLSEFFSKIGTSYSRDEEISLCRYYISVFESFYETNEKSDKAKAVLYKKLGIICALLTAIILI